MGMTAALLLLLTAQDARVTAEVYFNQGHARPDDALWAAVELKIEEGWHIYGAAKQENATPTVIEVVATGAEAGALKWPEPHVETEGTYKGMALYEGEVYVGVPLKAAADAAGEIKVTFTIRYQACDASVCEDEKTIEVAGTIKIGAGEPKSANPSIFKPLIGSSTAPPTAGGPNATELQAQEEVNRRGLLGFLLLAAGGGLLSLVMPCTYPIIPITLNYFLHQGGESRAKGMALSSMYALGVIVSFTGIGFAMALAIGPQGAQIFASNPWVNLAVAALFLAFALSFFGLFEIALPAALTQTLAGGGPRSGLGGAFLLGGLFAIVTFTCTIPILGVVLGVAASSAHRWMGFFSMLVYSATMALPFFALGAFPSMMKSIPKSGGWMHTVKVTVGFLELALALQYVANADIVFKWGVLTRPVMVAVWTVTWVIMAAYLLGMLKAPTFTLTRMIFATLFAALAIFFGRGLDGRPLGLADLVLPPATKVARPPDYETLSPALLAAKARQQPIFLEFTGAQ